MRTELTAREMELQTKLMAAEDELARLQEFKEQKQNMERALAQGEVEREAMSEDHKLALEALERKFLEEKNRLQKEYKQMLAEMKKSSQEEAVERLDSSTKKILFENRRMAEELRLQARGAPRPGGAAAPLARLSAAPLLPARESPDTKRTRFIA